MLLFTMIVLWPSVRTAVPSWRRPPHRKVYGGVAEHGCAAEHAAGAAMMVVALEGGVALETASGQIRHARSVRSVLHAGRRDRAAANRHGLALWVVVVACLTEFLGGCAAAASPTTIAEPTAVGLSSGAPTRPDGVPPASIAAESTAVELSSGSPTPADIEPVAPVRVLQLNLCNSGIAACYTGRSPAEAATVIHAEIPDLVTLNEICQDDLPGLQQSLADVVPDDAVVSAFQAARDRRTGDVYRCRNGQPYGIGLISRWPSVPGSAAGGGIYPSQDTDDPEERAWLCLGVAASPAITVCTTHLAYTKVEVAAAQCDYLFGTVIAEMRQPEPVVPVVLGADLNLGTGDSASVMSCLPAASARVDDGGVQLVVATPEFVVSGAQRIDLRGTTDHPGLLVTLSPAAQR